MVISKVDFAGAFTSLAKVDFSKKKGGDGPTTSGLRFECGDGVYSLTINYDRNYDTLHEKTLQYSYDGSSWTDWTDAVTIGQLDKLYVRGLDNYVRSSNVTSGFFTTNEKFKCYGNIMSLCNYAEEIDTAYCFVNLFKNSMIQLPP